MKKLLLILLTLTMSLTLFSCQGKGDIKTIEGTLEEIMNKIYSNADLEFTATMIEEITDTNIEYNLGTTELEYEEAIASNAMISSVAHSIVLVRVADDADIEAIKSKIKENANPRKWICVGVEEDQVIVDNVENLIVLIMDKEAEKLHESFLSLAE